MPHHLPSVPNDERALLEHMLDTQRREITALLDGLDDAAARARLVPSRTTVLGLVKHATFVELVWFPYRVAGIPRADLGIAATPDESFVIADDDTVESVRAAHLAACARSREVAAAHGLDEEFAWYERTITLRFIHLHVIAELARHAGHGDILVEQLRA